MFEHRTHTLLVGLFFILLASCGGSGSEGFNPPPPPPPPQNTAKLPITAANAQDITASVLAAVTSSSELTGILDIVGVPGIGSAGPSLAKPFAAIITEVIDCDTGQLTATWDDADDNLELSTGDTFDILFEMCFYADSATTLDGSTSITNLVITGDPVNQIAPWGLAGTFTYTDLSATDVDGTAIIDGAIDLDMSSDDNLIANISLAVTSLTTQQAGVTETLSDYVLAQTIDLNAMSQVISADGTLASTLLEGSVTFETLDDFIVMGDENPSSGQFLIKDDQSSVLVTVLDNLSVQLDIDLDLDGTIDATMVVNWTDLGFA